MNTFTSRSGRTIKRRDWAVDFLEEDLSSSIKRQPNLGNSSSRKEKSRPVQKHDKRKPKSTRPNTTELGPNLSASKDADDRSTMSAIDKRVSIKLEPIDVDGENGGDDSVESICNAAMYVICHFNDYVGRAYIDTASAESTISTTLAQSVLDKTFNNGDHIQLDVNLAQHASWSVVPDVQFLRNSLRIPVKVTEARGKQCLSLGLSFIMKHKCTIDFESSTLTVGKERVRVPLLVEQTPAAEEGAGICVADSDLESVVAVPCDADDFSCVADTTGAAALDAGPDGDAEATHGSNRARRKEKRPVSDAGRAHDRPGKRRGRPRKNADPAGRGAKLSAAAMKRRRKALAGDPIDLAPESADVLDFGDNAVFDRLDEALTYVEEVQNTGPYTYNVTCKRKDFGHTAPNSLHRIKYVTKIMGEVSVASSNTPFISMRPLRYECSMGRRADVKKGRSSTAVKAGIEDTPPAPEPPPAPLDGSHGCQPGQDGDQAGQEGSRVGQGGSRVGEGERIDGDHFVQDGSLSVQGAGKTVRPGFQGMVEGAVGGNVVIVDAEDQGQVDGTKKRNTTTKKVGCKAAIFLKEMLFFPDYKIRGRVTPHKRKLTSKLLKAAVKKGAAVGERKFVVCVPKEEDHSGHVMGEMAGRYNATHPAILRLVKERVREGATSLDEIRRWIKHFVTETLFAGRAPPPTTNRRFWPDNNRLRTAIHDAASAAAAADTSGGAGSSAGGRLKVEAGGAAWRSPQKRARPGRQLRQPEASASGNEQQEQRIVTVTTSSVAQRLQPAAPQSRRPPSSSTTTQPGQTREEVVVQTVSAEEYFAAAAVARVAGSSGAGDGSSIHPSVAAAVTAAGGGINPVVLHSTASGQHVLETVDSAGAQGNQFSVSIPSLTETGSTATSTDHVLATFVPGVSGETIATTDSDEYEAFTIHHDDPNIQGQDGEQQTIIIYQM